MSTEERELILQIEKIILRSAELERTLVARVELLEAQVQKLSKDSLGATVLQYRAVGSGKL